jgi:hypothetical protein
MIRRFFFPTMGFDFSGRYGFGGGLISDSDQGLLFPDDQGTQLSFMDAGSH